jgi:ribosomal protein S12 methylthiotransferase
MNVFLLSLGCPKNSVDSEKLLRGLTEKGFGSTALPEKADIVFINTCGFIEEAKRESIEEILKLAKIKTGNQKLIVFGCLAQRYRDELLKEIPEIDAVYGVGEEEKIINATMSLSNKKRSALSKAKTVSSVKTHLPYAYIKIAEGCSRQCTFCVIPSIRGEFKSRNPEIILKEAESCIKSGVKELILIAQDLTGFGKDLRDYSLETLLKDIASISGDFWIRLLYLYPTGVNKKLLEVIATEPKICKYIDIPFQHSEDRILRLMKRGGSRRQYMRLVGGIRQAVPDAALRTAFIVGFPGETDEDFHGLLNFIQKAKFERLGVFKYSKEEGTPAASMKGHVPKRIKEKRYHEIMRLQREISLDRNNALVGKRMRAIIEDSDSRKAVGRIYSQAPEIDGVTFIKGRGLKKGDFVEVEITKAYEYDLEGVVVT